MTDAPRYSLALSEEEIERYRFMAKLARQREAGEWAGAGLVPGAHVADVGCGPGLVTIELADVVGDTGSVVGIDRGADEVAIAGALIAQAGLTNTTVRQGDAWATGVEAGSLDVVVIRHVLAHNTADDQLRILTHARELLRPGGSLYAIDVDLTGFRMDPPAPDLDDLNEAYIRHLLDSGRDPSAGLRLGSLAAAAGFAEIQRAASISIPPPAALATLRPPSWAAREAMIESGHATADDVERWAAALTRFGATAVADNRAVFTPIFGIIART